MTVRATGLGSPRNGMPGWKPYVWRAQLAPAPGPAPMEEPKSAYAPGARRERQEILARILACMPDGVLSIEQAARLFGVTKRTIVRDLETLRTRQEAS